MNELREKKELQGVHFISISRKIEDIEEKGGEENGLYKVLPIKMKVESTYESLAALFESFEELDQGVVSIENFSIIPQQEGSAQLGTNLHLAMYLYTPAEKGKWPDKLIPSVRKAKKTAYTKLGPSPFIPKKEAELLKTISNQKPKPKLRPKLQLFLIFFHKKNPRAVINGKMVGIGDKIDHVTIVDIRADRVILNDGEESFELSMGK